MSEENESQVPSVVKERVAKIVFSIKKFLKRQSSIIFWTILLLLAVLAFPKVRDLVASKRVVLLTGPEGGLYRKMGHEIEDDFVEHSPWKFWGRSFSLTSQSTHGDEENRQIVAEDNSGKYLGFAQDGFMPSPNIRGVLHLYDAPLHIVVRKSFYESVRPPKVTAAKSDQTQSPEPETFSDIASKLRSDDYAGKVFLGLDRSGTRQTASVVLKHYGIDPDKVATTRDYDLKGAA